MLSKSLQKNVLDLTQPHDKIISSILIELKKGNFRDWSTWCTLIECHQIFNWSWDVDINVSFDPTLEHIDFLARYLNCSLIIDIDTLFKHVLKTPGALYIAPSSVQSVAPHNISFFNSSITNGESTKSSVTTETFRHR